MRFISRSLVLAVVICATLVATALAVTPPAGTPDLSQMAIQAADLGSGASIASEGYVKPASGVTAEYSRQWHASRTADGVAIEGAVTATLLFPSSTTAAELVAGEHKLFANKAEHKLLARLFAVGAHSKVKAKQIHFGRVRNVNTGDSGFVLPVTIHIDKHSYSTNLYEIQVSGVVSEVIVVARKSGEATKGGDELAGDVAGHVRSVLAASGSTGATGPTGATG